MAPDIITGRITYRHAGQDLPPGSRVEVSAGEAAALVRDGLARLAEPAPGAPGQDAGDEAGPAPLPAVLSTAQLIVGDADKLPFPAQLILVLCPVEGCMEDAATFRALCEEEGVSGQILAVNRAIADCPGAIDLAATLEADDLAGWRKARAAEARNADFVAFATRKAAGVDFAWRIKPKLASSGYFGVVAARLLAQAAPGNLAILTNAKLSGRHYYDPEGAENARFATYRKLWTQAREEGVFSGVFAFHYGSKPGWVAEHVLPAFTPDTLKELAA